MQSTSKYSDYLQELMTKVGISSLKELSNLSGISQWQLGRLEAGLLPRMEVELCLKLAQSLQVSVMEVIEKFYPDSSLKEETLRVSHTLNQNNLTNHDHSEINTIQQEYLKIQQELTNQKEILERQFQQETLQVLESYLIQFPTAIAKIEQEPNLSAQKVIPLLKFIEKLLKKWEIQTLEKVGDMVNYNPQIHQLMEGNAKIGEQVKVRYVGYIQGEKLLYRAKVSSVEL